MEQCQFCITAAGQIYWIWRAWILETWKCTYDAAHNCDFSCSVCKFYGNLSVVHKQSLCKRGSRKRGINSELMHYISPTSVVVCKYSTKYKNTTNERTRLVIKSGRLARRDVKVFMIFLQPPHPLPAMGMAINIFRSCTSFAWIVCHTQFDWV